jgi:hypothetical protein
MSQNDGSEIACSALAKHLNITVRKTNMSRDSLSISINTSSDRIVVHYLKLSEGKKPLDTQQT